MRSIRRNAATQIGVALVDWVRYNSVMKHFPLVSTIVIAVLTAASLALAAASVDFTGEYADKKFLNGQAVIQLSLEQTGKTVSIFFSGVRSDGQGVAPEINANGNVSGKGIVEFKFTDELKNAGTGTITKAGDDVVVSINTTRVADPRCLQFYKTNMRLKRVKK